MLIKYVFKEENIKNIMNLKKISRNSFLVIFVMIMMILIEFSGCLDEQRKFGDMQISSPAFKNGEIIPQKYTCHGADISPPLNFSSIPESTKSLAIILEDPDAPGRIWVHWIVYNLPNTTISLPENAGAEGNENLPSGAEHGVNSWSENNDFYRGPCPPSGTHRYYFRLYALDAVLNLEDGASKEQLQDAMSGHIIEEAELMGICNA